MKKMKFSVCALCAAMLLTSCGMTGATKGGLIGGASGGAVGALVGQLLGKGKGAAIGAAVGTAVGGGAGILIGNKMDKAKQAAELAQAKTEVLTDANGVKYVKCTFDSGLLFNTGSSTLNTTAQANINKFITSLLQTDNTFDMAIQGFTDNEGWKNSTVAQSQKKNLELSEKRAASVRDQIVKAGYPASRLAVQGFGEENPVADNSTAAGRKENRRVEVYIISSDDMIKAANAAAAK